MMGQLNCMRCQYRHEDNGNCAAVGGFCTAVLVAHCRLLQEYLDTGLTPEEVKKIEMETEAGCVKAIAWTCGVDINRLRKLAEADKDGRVVVLPCKVGDTVWRIEWTFETYPDESEQYVKPGVFSLGDIPSFGKTVFLTREEAEEALRKDKIRGTEND